MLCASRCLKQRPVISAAGPPERSLDFTSDNLTGGQKFRTLNVVDDYNREALGVDIDYSLPAQRVTRLLDRLVDQYGKPERLRTDNGPEFISRALQDWCSDKEVALHWIEPGKPTQTLTSNGLMGPFVERF